MIKTLFFCLFFYTTVLPSVKQELLGSNLSSWPNAAANKLDEVIKNNAHTGSYACFDADQTTYQWDLEESTAAYLEMKNILTREKLDSTLKLIPFLDTKEHNETLFSYYFRLCDVIDETVCYTWLAQVFSGMTLNELKINIDEMLQSNSSERTIPTFLTTLKNNSIIHTKYNVPIPNLYVAQQQLYNRLMANGIDVYVVTASQEELVRMVVSDPKYGYNVKPENVIGVSTLLQSNTQFTTSRKEIKNGNYNQTQHLNLKFTSYLWSPQPMFSGKYAAILTHINQWKMPILIAGDTPLSDGYMMFHAYNQARGTVRIWVNRKDAYLTLINQMKEQYVKEQRESNVTITADKDWIYVTPKDLFRTNEILTTTNTYMSRDLSINKTQFNDTSTNHATNPRCHFIIIIIIFIVLSKINTSFSRWA